MSEVKALTAEAAISVEDGVVLVKVLARADIIELLKAEAAKSENTIDDSLVKMVELAKNGLDWKGYAKSI